MLIASNSSKNLRVQNGKRKLIEAYRALLIYWLIWPFGAMIYAVKRFHIRRYRRIIICFIVFFGFTFIPSNEGMDAYRHIGWFQEAAKAPLKNYLNALENYANLKSEYLDIYIHTLYFLVGIFTDDGRWLLAAGAFVFGFFYIKTLGLVYDEFGKRQINKTAIFFLIFAAAYISINHISFMRFWTATWVFLFCFYNAIILGKKKYTYMSAFSVLIHFSFVLPVILLIGFVLIGRYKVVFFPILVLILIFSSSIISNLLHSSTELSDGVENKVNQYADEGVVSAKKADSISSVDLNWYVEIRRPIAVYFIYFVFVIVALKKKFHKDQAQIYLAQFILLLFTVNTILTYNAGFLGVGRFNKMLIVIICFYLFRNFILNNSIKYKWILRIGVPILLFYSVIEYRGFSDYINILAVAGNPIISIFTNVVISLQDILI